MKDHLKFNPAFEKELNELKKLCEFTSDREFYNAAYSFWAATIKYVLQGYRIASLKEAEKSYTSIQMECFDIAKQANKTSPEAMLILDYDIETILDVEDPTTYPTYEALKRICGFTSNTQMLNNVLTLFVEAIHTVTSKKYFAFVNSETKSYLVYEPLYFKNARTNQKQHLVSIQGVTVRFSPK